MIRLLRPRVSTEGNPLLSASLVRTRSWAWIVVGMAVIAPRAPAQTLDTEGDGDRTLVEVRAGAIYSDNVLRTPTSDVDGTTWSAGLGLDVSRESTRLQLTARGDLDWMVFPSDTYGDDMFGYFDGVATLALVPETFGWFFQETYGQLRADPFAAVTPDNLENVNYFTTGPDLTLRLGSATSIRLSGRYSTTNSESNELDGDRYRGELALIRQLSSASSASLNVTSESFEFDDATVNQDFDRQEAFARYELRGGRTELGLDLGYTRLEQENASSDGPLARLSLSRRLSPATRIKLDVGTQFSDAGDLLRGSLELQDAPPQDGSALTTSDPLESRFAYLSWTFNRNLTGLGFDVEYSDESYENLQSLDRTRTSYGMNFERRLNPVLTLRAQARLTRQSFDAGPDDEERQARAELAWAIGRTLELRLQYDRFDRDSSNAATEFSENRASVFASWSPLKQR